MKSEIHKISSKGIETALIIVSVIILYRGHNLPGGGFIGGLIASAGMVFYSISETSNTATKLNLNKPVKFIFLGLLFALISALPGLFTEGTIMKGQWIKIETGIGEPLKLGTPLLFDIGVYFAVMGVSLLIIYTLIMEWKWKP